MIEGMIERLLQRRAVLILTVLAAAVFVLAATMAFRKHEAAGRLDAAELFTQLTLRAARAAHELQSERGMSLGYLASDGRLDVPLQEAA